MADILGDFVGAGLSEWFAQRRATRKARRAAITYGNGQPASVPAFVRTSSSGNDEPGTAVLHHGSLRWKPKHGRLERELTIVRVLGTTNIRTTYWRKPRWTTAAEVQCRATDSTMWSVLLLGPWGEALAPELTTEPT